MAASNEPKNAESARVLRKKRIIAIVSVTVTVALFLWLSYYLVDTLILSYGGEGGGIKDAPSLFREKIQSYGNWGILVAFGIQVLQVIVSPIPGEVIETGMGLCFGWFWGLVICLAGCAVGSVVILVFVKKLGYKVVELFVSTEKINELRFINTDKKLESTCFLLYFIPGTPKDPLIFFFGLTRLSIPKFLILSSVARIPSIVTSTIGGHWIANGRFVKALVLYIIIGAVSLAGIFFYRSFMAKIREKHREKHREKELQKEHRNKK